MATEAAVVDASGAIEVGDIFELPVPAADWPYLKTTKTMIADPSDADTRNRPLIKSVGSF